MRLSPALFLALTAVAPAPRASIPKPAELLRVDARFVAGPDSRTGTLHLEATLLGGWHVNSHHPSEDYLIATSVQLEPVQGVQSGEPSYPAGQLKKFAFADRPLSVYEDRFAIAIPVSWSAEAKPLILTGSLNFQACNDTQCLAPASVPFRMEELAVGLSGAAVPLSQAPRSAPASSSAAGTSEGFGELLERRGLPIALLLVFVWGLGLNLTPCVYPVIPLTVSFFGGQAQGNSRRVFGLAALYVLGMATMYSALGVVAALSGRLFGVALQSPWVMGGVAAILVLLALSMFGLYEIRMPSAWMQKAGARAGAAGAYGMGLLVGVVAAPCIGPVVLALLTFVAARQNAAFGFLIFFVLSLGLGLPYLFLAVFSGSLSRLPRAGLWMEAVKSIFGWVLIAMAAYFLRTLVPEPAGGWLLPAVLALGGLALAVRAGSLRWPSRLAVAALFLAAAVFFLPRKLPASTSPAWRPYSQAAVASAGRPAVIDFSAVWCAPCLELDQKTFSDARVRQALSRRALFKADMTRAASPEVVALSEKYGILGVPTVLFLDADGHERRDLRLVGFEEANPFLARLERAP